MNRDDFVKFVSSYQDELVHTLLSWNSLDLMFHRHMIQYLSKAHMIEMYDLSNAVIEFIIKNKLDNIINIGCGIGLLEHLSLLKNVKIDSTEIKYMSIGDNRLLSNFDPYEVVRNKLNTKVTYWTDSIFSNNFNLDNGKYDYGFLIRYTPLTEDCKNKQDYETILNNLKKYINNLIIIDLESKVPYFLKTFRKGKILKYSLYNVPLEKFNFSKIKLL